MNNRGGSISLAAGFTIVETLIVLAVTSTLLISAMVSMSGRQAKTEFQVATQSAVREYQSIISQIESGRYKSPNNFTCTSAAPNNVTFTSDLGGDSQGANQGCVYLGLALVFGEDASTYKKYLVAGSRLNGPVSADTITDANPTTHEMTLSNHVVTRGLEYAGARYVSSTDGSYTNLTGANVPVAVRLLTDLNGTAGSTGDLAGSSKVSVYATETLNAATIVNSINAVPPEQRMRGVELCFASAGLDRSVIISIGNGLGNKVDSTVKDGKKCGWLL